MVDTIKFSEFADGGDLINDNVTVGLENAGNTKFNNPWTFLAPGTTGDRPAITPEIYYRLRFNTQLQVYEYYDPIAVDWIQVSSEAIFAALASHLAGQGASLIGLQDQSFVTNKTVQDLANATVVTNIQDDIFVNGQVLAGLTTGFVTNTTVTGILNTVFFIPTANQIDITNVNGVSDPVFSLSSTLDLPGTFNIQSSTAVDSIINDDTMVLATATNLSTSLSIKNYVDASVAGSVTSLTGTANQVLVNGTTGAPQTGAITLTLPQSIAITSSPTFASITTTNDILVNSIKIGNGNIPLGNNTIFGQNSGDSFTTALENCIFGYQSGRFLTTGNWNCLFGFAAGFNLTTNSSNVLIGQNAGQNILAGDYNTLIGDAADAPATCTGALALGASALAVAATGNTSGDSGPGISFGSTAHKVGFRGDGTPYTGGSGRGFWRPYINDAPYLIPLFIDGTLTASAVMITNGSASPILSTTLPSNLSATNLTLTTPILGTPQSGNLSNCTSYPTSALSGLGTGVATALAINIGSAGSVVLFNGALGTPSSGTLSSCTGLPVSTGISGLGTGVATALAAAVSGSGSIALTTSPAFTTPSLGVATATSINFGVDALSSYTGKTSFTPTFTTASPGDLSVSYATQSGFYVRIGALIFFHIALVCTPTFITATGSLQIAGLPVTPSSIDIAIPINQVNGFTWPAGRTFISAAVTSGSKLALIGSGSAVAPSALTTTAIVSGAAISVYCSGSYFA